MYKYFVLRDDLGNYLEIINCRDGWYPQFGKEIDATEYFDRKKAEKTYELMRKKHKMKLIVLAKVK